MCMNDKNLIRAQMRESRKNFGGAGREAADLALLNAFFSAFGGYGSYFIYNSFSSEARTDLIIERLIQKGKAVFLPRVEGNAMVSVPYGGGFKKGAFGIFEPLGEPSSDVAEVTVAPLLAVNPRGFRIGYGGGFYDRYLNGKNTLKVGMGYAFQLRGFTEEQFDVPLDAFISEKGVIGFSKRGGGNL